MSRLNILSIGDTHCGHDGGLTAPEFQRPLTNETDGHRLNVAQTQRDLYNWHRTSVVHGGPYDIVILGGDFVDGKQGKSDGEDLWSTRRKDQVECAVKCLRPLIRKGRTKVFGVKGTRYHTEGDWDDEVLEELGAEVSHHEFLEINGKVFDVKHKIGCGGAPSSRPGVRNEWLHSLIWNAHGAGPRADVVIRHHAHTYWHEGDGAYLGIVVPGMQWFSDFGQLNVSRWIGIGCVKFTMETGSKEMPKWEAMLAKLDGLTVRPKLV